MLPWTAHRYWCLTPYAVFSFVACSVLWAMPPLAAQEVPDIPAAPTGTAPEETTPNPPSVPAKPIPETSAATVVSDSKLSPDQLNALSPGAGVAPVIGTGAAPRTDLGDRLDSATAAGLPFRVTATLSETYDDNIFAAHDHETADSITRLSATGELRLGALQDGPTELYDANYFDAIYTPTLRLYADNSHEDGVDQDVDVLYAHRWTSLTLSVEQVYSSLQATNASIGGLVTADTYSTTIRAKYVYSPKVDIISDARQVFTDYNRVDYTDTKEWSGEVYGLYHFDPKFTLGFGPRFGYLDQHDAPAETYQQALLRATYIESEKLNFNASAGGEYRQYQTYQRSSTLEPIFTFAGVYMPTPSTTYSVNAARRYTPAYGYVGNDYVASNIYLGAKQRFFDVYYLKMIAGYENDDYSFNLGGPTRQDNYFFVQPEVSWQPNTWLQVGGFYRYEEDSSNFTLFSYDINQVGVSCSATY